MESDSFITNRDFLESVSFCGLTLGPLFREDPLKGSSTDILNAFATLNPDNAAEEWLFAAPSETVSSFRLMREGLENGIASPSLVDEFRRLFIGPAPMPAPPWGSVYLDRESVIFGSSTLELRSWMRMTGIERIDEESIPEDHIGLMLILMSWIAENKPGALTEFLREHVLPWSSHFLKTLAPAAKQPFYKGLALLTDATLNAIGRELALEIPVRKFYR